MKIVILAVLCCLLSACQLFEEKRKMGTVAEYNGKTITVEQIEMLTAGLAPEDSSRIAQHYIRQWAIDLIEYDKAKDQTNKTIEQLVEDYRRSLYTLDQDGACRFGGRHFRRARKHSDHAQAAF